MKSLSYLYLILMELVIFSSCLSQSKDENELKIDRQPAVAGSFYSSNRKELFNTLESLFIASKEIKCNDPLALIVPHAGYVFSAGVAASAYKQLDRYKSFEHVFIIGSSHTMYFDGASVYTKGDFITPLGKVEVDSLARILDDKYDFINNDSRAHQQEHSLEVQLPFLQYWLKKPFTIVPIIIGGSSQRICKYLADALTPYFTDKNLFIISSDFSHYPKYDDAITTDSEMANAIASNSAKMFMQTKLKIEGRGIPNLATAMCGWTSALTLLNITERNSVYEYIKVDYKNSGDTEFGDKEKVVGYNAICVVKSNTMEDKNQFSLTEEDKIELLQLARQTIEEYLIHKRVLNIDATKLSATLRTNAGAFVTLKNRGSLRGCIGNFSTDIPLYKVVQSMAIAAATQDYRFDPVSSMEMPELDVEISVLTPMKKISSIEEIVLGKHGIYIRKGSSSGTFLPQVAAGTGWSKEEFLGHCARDKAFIGWDGWKTADIYTYEAIVFEEKEFKDKIK